MKKSVAMSLVVLSVAVMFSLSLVSALTLEDFFGKTSGNAVRFAGKIAPSKAAPQINTANAKFGRVTNFIRQKCMPNCACALSTPLGQTCSNGCNGTCVGKLEFETPSGGDETPFDVPSAGAGGAIKEPVYCAPGAECW